MVNVGGGPGRNLVRDAKAPKKQKQQLTVFFPLQVLNRPLPWKVNEICAGTLPLLVCQLAAIMAIGEVRVGGHRPGRQTSLWSFDFVGR